MLWSTGSILSLASPRLASRYEIVKERQMEFDIETDPETMYELFGDDYVSFGEGPVWVYVLERRRAVEVWHTLMGHPDPEVARQETPHSLRALYGISREQNGLMGSSDAQAAEIQILSIFASSPPFPTTELPDVPSDDALALGSGSLRSVSSSILEALQQQNGSSENGYAGSTATNPSTVGGSRNGGANGSNKAATTFKARPLPPTHVKPDIAPRMSRAAALRAGIVLEAPKRAVATKESLAKTFANVPGHKRSETISVASTAPPVVAPRMTRAASLRLGQKPPEKPTRRTSSVNGISGSVGVAAAAAAKNTNTFEGVPGHKRRESIAVASTKPPTVAPRLNKSASLRVQKEAAAPPSSFMFRGPSQGPSRSSSRNSMNGPPPTTTTTRPSVSRPASAQSIGNTASTSRPNVLRTMSSNTTTTTTKSSTSPPNSSSDAPAVPAKAKSRRSSIQAPSIAPRQNKSAMLRAAKMAATNAAAAAAVTNGKTPVLKKVNRVAAAPRVAQAA
ncbi:unnamed protein product [Somion occarium]|uniref:Nucleoside diphosphate kinase n=1 Tax=Somion occarium TaxID=3059160 RepID=A0ABP1DZM7_9APHY